MKTQYKSPPRTSTPPLGLVLFRGFPKKGLFGVVLALGGEVNRDTTEYKQNETTFFKKPEPFSDLTLILFFYMPIESTHDSLRKDLSRLTSLDRRLPLCGVHAQVQRIARRTQHLVDRFAQQ